VGTGKALAIILPVLLLTWINVIGVKSGVRTAVFLAITKTLPLLVFIFVGIFYVLPSLATSVTPKPGAGGLGDAVLLLLYAYAGFENTAAPAGEFKNPRRDVPFALITQIVIVTLIYSAVQWVALGTLPGVVNSQTPLADAAARFLPWGGLLMTVGGVISILGTNGNTVLSGPRYLYALARDGFGPRFLATLHPKYRTPAAAVVLQTAIALPLAFTGSFEALATLSNVARLATYFGTALAVPVLRRKLPREAVVRLPGGPAIPIAAALLCVVFAASAKVENLIAGAIALVAGGLIYFFWRRPVTPDTEP
jgi:amino acid transporter